MGDPKLPPGHLPRHIARVVNFRRHDAATMPARPLPRVRVDQPRREVRFITQGLMLGIDRHVRAADLDLYEVVARSPRGTVRGRYRYLVDDRGAQLTAYRVPIQPDTAEPADAWAWVSRGGYLQGATALVPDRLPGEAAPVERQPGIGVAAHLSLAERLELFAHLLSTVDPATLPEDLDLRDPHWADGLVDGWRPYLGDLDPSGGELLRAGERLYLRSAAGFVLRHPKHPTLVVPAGTYRLTRDRASARWGVAGRRS